MSEYISDYEIVQNRVLELRTEMCRVVRAPNVVRWMPSFISAEEVSDIQSIDSRHPEKASFMMIDRILKCTQSGKWKTFLEALEHADYPYIASLIKSEEQGLEQYQHQRKMLQVFAPYLELQLEPCDLISHIGALDLINTADIDEIKACQGSRGSVAATMLMLDRLQRRQKPSQWYIDFLKILYQKGHRDIVRAMEPDFTLDCEVLKVPAFHVTENTDSAICCNDIVEEMIEAKVMNLKSELTAVVKVRNIAPALCHDQLLDIEKVCQLIQMSSQKESIDSMLEEIHKLKNKTKWRSFINCLKKSEYSHVADLLSRPGIWKLQCKERELLRLFLPTLSQQLNPSELVPHLEEENLINHIDKEEILSTFRQSGCTAASLVLLDCLQCRAAPHVWFSSFIKILVKIGREDLVEIINPDFYKAYETLQEENNGSQSYTNLLSKRDKTLSHIYKFEKAAMGKLDIIQRHFEEMKDKLKDQIEVVTSTMTKSLNDVDEMLQAIHSEANEVDEDYNGRIEEILNNIISTNFILRPENAFMDLNEVGVLQYPRHVLVRQNSFDKSPNNSWPATFRNSNMKRRVIALREKKKSTSSSNSSQSSGYLIVEKSSSLSSSSSAVDLNSNTTSLKDRVLALRRRQQFTSSSGSMIRSSDHLVSDRNSWVSSSLPTENLETYSSSSMDNSTVTFSTRCDKGNVNHDERISQASFDTISEDVTLRYHGGQKPNVSRKNSIDIAGSFMSLSDLPTLSNKSLVTLPFTEATGSKETDPDLNLDLSVFHTSPVCEESASESNKVPLLSEMSLSSPTRALSATSNETDENGALDLDRKLSPSSINEVQVQRVKHIPVTGTCASWSTVVFPTNYVPDLPVPTNERSLPFAELKDDVILNNEQTLNKSRLHSSSEISFKRAASSFSSCSNVSAVTSLTDFQQIVASDNKVVFDYNCLHPRSMNVDGNIRKVRRKQHMFERVLSHVCITRRKHKAKLSLKPR